MRKILAAFALLVLCSASYAQQGLGNLPPNTVVGRLGAGVPGPAQAIPFAALSPQLFKNIAPITVSPAQAPSSLGLWDSLAHSFTGDNSHIVFGIQYSITGTASLGEPSTGYVYTPELTPNVTYFQNQSGWNQSTSTNTGRTAATAYRTYVNQLGQGDAVAFNATCFANATKAGATSFLANPACTLFNGDTGAGQAGVFLNPIQSQIEDNGFDVAGMGVDIELNRTVATGALNAWWSAYRAQSIGTQPIDVGFSLIGPANYGLDFSYANLGSNQAAITLLHDQKIYGNVTAGDALSRFPTALNGTYITYQNSNSGWQLLVNNTNSAIFTASTDLLFGTVDLGIGSANYVQVIGGGTGIAPNILFVGSDTNVTGLLATQGSGPFLFRTEGNGGPTQFLISDTASATDYIQVTGSNGGAPTLSTNGGNLTIAPNGGTTSVTGALTATTTVRANSAFSANGTVGVSTTCTVTASNTYVFTFGLLTSKGANCT